MIYAGSLVFAAAPADGLRDWSQWWTFMKGADWRHPYGPKEQYQRPDSHPVVHVSYRRRARLCQWAGKDCPRKRNGNLPPAAGSTARSSPGATSYARWQASGQHLAGRFPSHNLRDDGYERTSPVTAFPPNGFGVHDMIGNVWEWTSDWYSPKHEADAPKACCIPENPRGGRQEDSFDPRQPNVKIPRKVIKGGSHRARRTIAAGTPGRAARGGDRYSTSHLGFRCVVRRSQQLKYPSEKNGESNGPSGRRQRPDRDFVRQDRRKAINRRNILLGTSTLVAAAAMTSGALAQAQKTTPAAPAAHPLLRSRRPLPPGASRTSWSSGATTSASPISAPTRTA